MIQSPEAINDEYLKGGVSHLSAATDLVYSLRKHPIKDVLEVLDPRLRVYFREHLLGLASAETDDDLGWVNCPKPFVTLEEVRQFAEDLRRYESGGVRSGQRSQVER